MAVRLCLGHGAVGHALAETARDRGEPVHIVTRDPDRIASLDMDPAVTTGDPSEPSVLCDLDERVTSVFVGTDDPERNLAIARTASAVFSDVPLVAYAGRDATAGQRAELSSLADSVIDHDATIERELLQTVTSEPAERALALRRLLVGVDGTLGVILHDNPDPDAIASGVALSRLSRAVGTEAQPCYFGEITHQENRALVNLLDLELRNLQSSETVGEFDALALVDHSLPGINDQLPTTTPIDVVIDHHPSRGPVGARYRDVRSEVGSTSALLVEYHTSLGIEIDETVATALLFGIRTDTDDFSREGSRLDFEAARTVLARADAGLLEQLERPTISPETLETIAGAIRNCVVRETVCTSCVGALRDRDALAQAADRLLNMEGVTATVVYGFRDGTVYVSARAQGTDLDIGEVLREAFDQIGSAGGHADMAGAQVPLGFIGEEAEDQEALIEIVRALIDERFFETIDGGRTRGVWPTGERGGWPADVP